MSEQTDIKKPTKLTQVEMKNIVDNAIYGGVVSGQNLNLIERKIREMLYTQKEKKEILEKIRAHIEDAADLDPKVVKGICVINMQNLYKKLYETGDYPNAIRALERLFKMTNSEINERVYPEETKDVEKTNE